MDTSGLEDSMEYLEDNSPYSYGYNFLDGLFQMSEAGDGVGWKAPNAECYGSCVDFGPGYPQTYVQTQSTTQTTSAGDYGQSVTWKPANGQGPSYTQGYLSFGDRGPEDPDSNTTVYYGSAPPGISGPFNGLATPAPVAPTGDAMAGALTGFLVGTITNAIVGPEEEGAYLSFRALKAALGPAGKDMVYHHIVEQAQIKASGFASSLVNNVNNVVAIDSQINHAIGTYYSTGQAALGGLSPRAWLAGQSFEAQFNYGVSVLGRYLK